MRRITCQKQKEKQHISPNGNSIESVEFLPGVVSATTWLELNKLPWMTVLSQWEVSFPARQASLRQHSKVSHIIHSFPHLAEEFGYQLLDIDYRKQNLGNPADPSKKRNLLFEPIAQYISKNTKDPSAKDLCRGLKENMFDFFIPNVQGVSVIFTAHCKERSTPICHYFELVIDPRD
ncbi:uncharacterized protein LOC129719206 [Wyeomyia smithii]|uniref:uncharacterized protein LOC129719206 n=1 Tax=Wyeomyia smithii TaxID=174621 RepID=UPI002467C150|nr:uncharacterized protein LOC129719206 [Wyeomyia smithii]